MQQISYMLLLALSIAPGLAICIYIYWKDKFEKEPKKLLALSFFLGVISFIPIVIIEMVVVNLGLDANRNILITALFCIVGIGLVEKDASIFSSAHSHIGAKHSMNRLMASHTV